MNSRSSRKDWQVYGANCEANRFLFLADKIRTAGKKNRTRDSYICKLLIREKTRAEIFCPAYKIDNLLFHNS